MKLLRGFKNIARILVDKVQVSSVVGIEVLGDEATWAICADRLKKGARVLSGGVGNDISFEYKLIDKFEAEVAIFDPSPTGNLTIEKLRPLPEHLVFFEFGLAGKTGIVKFSQPVDMFEGSWKGVPPGGSADCEFRCLDYASALAAAGWSSCDLLKIDIEGFEYEFIESMAACANLPGQIAVEMHGFLPGHSLLESMKLRRLLREVGYKLVWKRREDHLFLKI